MVSILKFGGTSLMNGVAFKKSADIIMGKHRPLVVLSAVHGVTKTLEKLLYFSEETDKQTVQKQLDEIYSIHNNIVDDLSLDVAVKNKINNLIKNKLDFNTGLIKQVFEHPTRIGSQYLKENIMVTGEQISGIIMSNYLKMCGRDTKLIEGNELFICGGLINPYPQEISKIMIKNRIVPLLNTYEIPIITGFYGRDRHDNIITFGRNGSDVTATFIADTLGINRVEIYKVEVSETNTDWKAGLVGVVDDNGETISELFFDEAMTIAQTGRDVLSHGMLRPLVTNKNIIIIIKNTMHPELVGTTIVQNKL